MAINLFDLVFLINSCGGMQVGLLKRSIDLAIKSFRKWMAGKEVSLYIG
jgi:hypothetical protein